MTIPYIDYPATRPRRVMPLPVPEDTGYEEYPIPQMHRESEVRSPMSDVGEIDRQDARTPSFDASGRPATSDLGLRTSDSESDLPLPVRVGGELPLGTGDPLPHWPTARAAQGEADERALAEPGSQYRAYEKVRDTRPQARGGVWGHILAAGKGLAYGGLGGAVVGAVSPQTIRDYEWRNRDIPRAEEQASIERGEQKRQLDAGLDIARSSGIDPWTQQPTEMARDRQQRQESLTFDRRARNEDRDRDARDREQTAIEKRAAAELDRSQRLQVPVDANAVKGSSLKRWAGKTVPWSEKPMSAAEASADKSRKAAQDLREREFKWKREHGGQEMTAAQKAADERAYRREDAAAAKEEEKTKDNAEKARRKAQSKIDQHNQLRSNPKATPEQIEASRQEALAAVDEAATDYPDLLEGAEGTGGVPYVKWVGGKRPAAAAVAPRSSSARGRTITRGEYDQQVKKHGQQKVDDWLGKKGIKVR